MEYLMFFSFFQIFWNFTKAHDTDVYFGFEMWL